MSDPKQVTVLLDSAARVAAGKDAFPFERMTGVQVQDSQIERVRVTLSVDTAARRAAGKKGFPFVEGHMTGVTLVDSNGHVEDEVEELPETRVFSVIVTALPDDLPSSGDIFDALRDGLDLDVAIDGVA